LENGTIGKYNMNDKAILQHNTVCDEDKNVVGFHFNDKDDLLLTVCSNSSLSEIIVSKFELSIPIQRIITTDYRINNVIVSNEGHLVFVAFSQPYYSVFETSFYSASSINQSKILIVCAKKADSFAKFMKLSSVENVTSKILSKFNEEIYTVVEVCTPNEIFYTLLLKDRLVSIDANTLEQISESDRFTFYLNFDRIKMTATTYEILLADGSGTLRRYNFYLKQIMDIYCYYCAYGAIFYDDIEDKILITDKNYILEYMFSYITQVYNLQIDDDILFYKTANYFIYFIMTNGTIGKYDMTKREYELSSKMCSNGTKVVAFQAHEDDTLLTVCTMEATTEIILSKYGKTNSRKTLVFDQKIKNMFITSNGQILASVYNNVEEFSLLINVF
jgi:hypothetical protein